MGIPFEMRAEMKNFKASVYLRFSRTEPVLSYSFLGVPAFDLDMDLTLHHQSCPPWMIIAIKNFLVPLHLKRKLVAPHCKTLVYGKLSNGAGEKKKKRPSFSQQVSTTTTTTTTPTSAEGGAMIAGRTVSNASSVMTFATTETTTSASSIAASTLKWASSSNPVSASADETNLLGRSDSIRSTSTTTSTTTTTMTTAAITTTGASMANRLMKNISSYREQIKDQVPGLKEKVSVAAGGLLARIQEKRTNKHRSDSGASGDSGTKRRESLECDEMDRDLAEIEASGVDSATGEGPTVEGGNGEENADKEAGPETILNTPETTEATIETKPPVSEESVITDPSASSQEATEDAIEATESMGKDAILPFDDQRQQSIDQAVADALEEAIQHVAERFSREIPEAAYQELLKDDPLALISSTAPAVATADSRPFIVGPAVAASIVDATNQIASPPPLPDRTNVASASPRRAESPSMEQAQRGTAAPPLPQRDPDMY